MQIVEASSDALKVVAYKMTRREESDSVDFLILPVFHVGERRFYDAVFDRLQTCDVVLYEGLHWKRLNFLACQYHFIAQKLGLVLQQNYLKLSALPVELVHADLSKEEARMEWKKVRCWDKFRMRWLNPLVLRLFAIGLNRERLARQFVLATEREELWLDINKEKKGSIDYFLTRSREKKLYRVIDEQIEKFVDQKKKIGIVFGAGHIQAVLRHLIKKHGWAPAEAEFLEVYAYKS